MLLSTLLFLENPGTIIFIVAILVLFFGAKRIPELFRGLGQGMKEFKDATRPDAPNYQAPQPGYNPPAAPGAYDPNAYPAQHPAQYPTQPAAYPAAPTQQVPYGTPAAPGQAPTQVPPAPYNPANTPAG